MYGSDKRIHGFCYQVLNEERGIARNTAEQEQEESNVSLRYKLKEPSVS